MIKAALVALALIVAMPAIAADAPEADRKATQYKKWHWYELSDGQHQRMVTALKGLKARQPVNVLCGDADCRDLAKDFVDAFEDAGWKVSMISSGFVGNDPGLHCSAKEACEAITRATGIKTTPFESVPGTLTIMFGPKK